MAWIGSPYCQTALARLDIDNLRPGLPKRNSRQVSEPSPSWSRVVLHQLDLDAPPLFEERGVHAGEVAPVGCFAGLHARLDQGVVGAVDVVGTKSQVPEVHVRVVGAA